MRRDPNRERQRARQACRNCRKKKARCPSEKPACSSCVRLNQPCIYDEPRPPDRLADLEKKVDSILNCRGQPYATDPLDEGVARGEPLAEPADPPEPLETTTEFHPNGNTETSYTNFASDDPRCSATHSLTPRSEFLIPKLNISKSAIDHGLDVYFERFHRQPIWCFDRQDLGHNTDVSKELIYSILELTARFLPDHDTLMHDHDPPRYGENARWSIMLRVANDTVELETIESLCLLSYSAFIDGDICRGQFYLGLGLQLCRSARLDRSSLPLNESPNAGREKRLLWSLQILEQFYSDQDGILGTAPEVWRSYYLSDIGDAELPRETTGSSTASDMGIWSLSLYFGWLWSRVRYHVSECSRNKLMEPWRLDSTYAKVLADMTEIENKAPLRHRYDIVKFYERPADEVRLNRDYWMPWLKLQFIWHSILMTINHPFLYIAASQYHPDLAIPNTFWRKSSEQVLLHATWIVRTIDMTHEKEVKLLDPFFGHAAAIAATVHLYFCSAADPRLRQKSKADFAKCKKFLESFSIFSHACESLARLLDKLTQIALESEKMDYESTPSRIQLSIPLMWAVLQFDISNSKATASPSGGLLASPTLSDVDEMERNPTLEVTATESPPAVIIDPALGHDARLPPYKASSTSPELANGGATGDIIVPPAESFMFNTPWFWTDPSEFANTGNTARFPLDSTMGNSSEGFSTWGNFGNL